MCLDFVNYNQTARIFKIDKNYMGWKFLQSRHSSQSDLLSSIPFEFGEKVY